MSTSKNKERYSQECLRNALQEVDRGMPVATASKTFGVPRTTLLYKKTGKYPRECRKGPPTNLTQFEEESLVKWLFHTADRGFPATKQQLIDSVEMLFKESKRKNNFVNGRPGKKWYASFIKRHPEISYRVSQNLSSGRTAVTEEKLRNWFTEVRSYLEENNYFTILEDPARIFNADESAFFLSPSGSKVLVKKGSSTVYNFTANNDKECMTALINANAAGMVAPPMVIYQYERIPPHITYKMPLGWAIGKSDTGWMTGQTFFEYIGNVFLPWVRENKIELPIILFVDGHSSHLTLPLSDLCSENGIILIALCPNSTHITQPIDVAVFRTLKSAWRGEVQRWRMNNNGAKVKKDDFAPILEQAILASLTPEVLANGFRSTGLQPFNPDAIKYDKYFKVRSENNRFLLHTPLHQDNKLIYFEGFIKEETLASFQSNVGHQWEGDVKDESLYFVWKAIKAEYEAGQNKEKNDTLDSETQEIVCNEILPEPENYENLVEMVTPPETVQKIPREDNQVQENVPQPSTSLTSINEGGTPLKDVPTPFKKCLFWPKSQAKDKMKKSKVKLPAVASSTTWKEYQLNKEKMKEEQEKAKAERKLKREAKRKAPKEKIKQVKRKVLSSSSSDSSMEMVLESEEELIYKQHTSPKVDLQHLTAGDFVIVRYDEDYYPGVIRTLTDEKAFISVMQKSLTNTWKWPTKEDCLYYDLEDITEKIQEPVKANERGAFKVPEFIKYSDYF